MVSDRNTAILYTTATCNLNCVYCYIDKNPALVKIDNILDESFKGDYYFNFMKEMFPDPQQLTEVEFWGGEPSLRLDRAIHTIRKCIQHFPNLNRFFMSTNFTNTVWNDQFFGFIDMLNEFPDRQFEFSLQLSLDGPTEINDAHRGKGVTERFSKQFVSFIDILRERGRSNVKITAGFKPTLTIEIIREHLSTKEDIINYYKFFENYLNYAYKYINEVNLELWPPIPNTACPAPHTKDDGLVFADFCRKCREIEKENREHKIFDFYKEITVYQPRMRPNYENISFCQSCGACGSGKYNVGFLPYDMISCCHNGFTSLITEYKDLATKHDSAKQEKVIDFGVFIQTGHYMIQTKESYKQYEKNVDFAYNPFSKTKLANMTSTIMLLAMNDQVDKKYRDPKEALKGALFLQFATSYCFRDNTSITGSAGLFPVGLPKLLLNGAREVIENNG